MDIVVTVPKGLWTEWLAEGDLPGEPTHQFESHFWIPSLGRDRVIGDRCYVVAHGRLRGYAPIVDTERRCRLRPSRACVVRRGGAVAVTIDQEIRGFQGWKYRWWDRSSEVPFPDWQTAGVR